MYENYDKCSWDLKYDKPILQKHHQFGIYEYQIAL